MASNTLFPPVVNSTEPAFITYPRKTGQEWNPGELRIYFKFSALNADLDHKDDISVHATIHLKESGSSVVNIVNGEETTDYDEHNHGTFLNTYRLRATQIILNLKPVHIENSDLWYITLKNEDIDYNDYRRTIDEDVYYGWLPGSFYKVQIRLSEVLCDTEEDEMNQQRWLYEHADQFSEWSTVIYSKCLSDFHLHHSDDYHWREIAEEPPIVYPHINKFPQTFQGSIEFKMGKNKEYYESCLLRLYESNGNHEKVKLLEEANIYPNDISMNNYNYTIKYDFKASDNETYYYYFLEFSFVTENKYQSDIFTDWFYYPENTENICNYKLVTVDTTDHPLVEKIKDGKKYFTSLGKENENACVGLKLEYDPVSTEVFHWEHVNLRIVRSSEDTNFTVWEVIKYINLTFSVDGQPVDPRDEENLSVFLERMPIIYDYSIESNTFYQYGIQSLVSADPEQWSMIKKLSVTVPNPAHDPEADPPDGEPETIKIPKRIQRDFEYSYLLGKNQQQLKIKFNDNVSNYMPQVYDNKLEPIGSQFPYTYRNAKTDYRTFPIAGTISFEMDDNETFLVNGDLDIYNGYEEVRELHEADKKAYGRYNYGYERRFRQKVIDYLKDGAFKLFKSATEGNIMVRLRDVGCTPNQQLSRLIYNFTANADEVDINDLDNLKKYGLIYPGTYATEWSQVTPIDIPADGDPGDTFHVHGMSTTVITPSNIPPAKEEEG